MAFQMIDCATYADKGITPERVTGGLSELMESISHGPTHALQSITLW
jgi:hypothetical protein